MNRKSAFAGAAGFVLLVAIVGGAKPAQWYELRSEHFHVLTDAQPKKAEKIIQKLEEFRSLLSQMFGGIRLDPPIPTTVIMFKNSKSIRPYQRLGPDGKPMKNAGFMRSGTERMYLVINLSAPEPIKTAFHEYIHLVMHLSADNLPVWLDEGVAEFYEETEIRGRAFKVGFFQAGSWQLMRRSRLIPLEVFQRVDRHSDYYTQERKRHVFYAQSWLFVHYLMVADNARRQPQLGRYFKLILQGVPVEQAFEQAFQTDYAVLEKELKRYLGKTQIGFYKGKLKQAWEPSPLQVEPISSTVALAYVSDLWLNSGRVDEAENALQQLAAAEPSSPEVQYRLGRIRLLREQPEEAEAHFEAALASRPDDISLRYYAALAIAMGRMKDGLEGENRAAATRVVELLIPLVEAKSDFADAYQLLVQARLLRNDSPAEVIPVVERLRQLKPQDPYFAVLLANLYIQEQRWDDAEGLLRTALQRFSDPYQHQQAERMLEWLEQRRERAQLYSAYQEEEAENRETLESDTRERAAPRNLRGGPLRRGAEPVEPPAAPPPAAPPKIAYLVGTLVNVACADDTAALTVVTEPLKGKEGQTFHLWVRSRARVLLLDPTDTGQTLDCGPSGKRVGINYRVQPREPNIAGIVVTIEFNPPAI
jgi:thioredoxin-like negative regulator of GroEL